MVFIILLVLLVLGQVVHLAKRDTNRVLVDLGNL